MSGAINWKQKYQEVKSKWMDSVDLAFRMGFEQGQQQAQMDQMAQQQAEAQAAAQADQGQPGEEGGAQQPLDENDAQPPVDDAEQGATMPAGPGLGIQPADSENPAGSELDQHIQELEGLIGKSEELDVNVLKKSIETLKRLQKSQKEQLELKKSAQAIPAIARALHTPKFRMSQNANHNLSTASKQAVGMQEKIVTDIMEKWAAEENRAGKDILAQLGIEGLTKK